MGRAGKLHHVDIRVSQRGRRDRAGRLIRQQCVWGWVVGWGEVEDVNVCLCCMCVCLGRRAFGCV